MTNKDEQLKDEIDELRYVIQMSKEDMDKYLEISSATNVGDAIKLKLAELKGRQEARKEMIEEFEKMIDKTHIQWHPIDRRGAYANEECDKDNCPFTDIKQQLKELEKQ